MSKKESAARPGREQRSVTPRLPKAEPTPCLCGCELPTNNDYAQGHDARHVSNLFYEVVGGQRSRSSALRQLKSASLKTKLAARLDRHAAKAKAAKEESDDE